MMVEYVKEMTAKKSCKYGKYGSFEHLLFLLSDINETMVVSVITSVLLTAQKTNLV